MRDEGSATVVGRLLLAMIVAIVALIAASATTAKHFSGEVRDGADTARLEQTLQLRAGCKRGVSRDLESLQVNADIKRISSVLKDFADEASAARRADGNPNRADRYLVSARQAADVAARANVRVNAIDDRLPSSGESVDDFCRHLYPVPKTH